ncbi:MAG: NAD(P)/FAD-dependent oxidoreductase [Clostridia bacterium]|nr:NAD(P)/FAD-dependent oxidoreductase [Clostridia bacterium]
MSTKKTNKHYETLIIGGGPAGLAAAYASLKAGKATAVIERNDRPGKKLLITGKGRCNITNAADISDFISNVPVNSNFLYSAFYTFTNDDLIRLLNDNGLETKVERGQRIFPKSDRAADVLKTLLKITSGADFIYNTRVKSVLTENGSAVGVKAYDNSEIYADRVIIATGGKSYSVTGSTGDGYRLASELGHTVIEPKPSLVPLETDEVYDLMGLALKNIGIKIRNKNGKIIYEDFGEMVFTHFGVSGPVILSASSHLRKIDGQTLSIDLKPALSEKQLDARIIRDFEEFSRKNFSNSLDELLPKKLIPVVVELSGIPPETKIHQITKAQRQTLLEVMKDFTLHIKGMRPIDEAIITSGGIKVSEINPSTMESKLVKNLYFAGEVIDVDAYTGGFNLQIAFSTGFLSGNS